MTFRHWLHHLFNPHCLQCEQLDRELDHCKTCEELRSQLEVERARYNLLLDKLLRPPVVESAPIKDEEDSKPLPINKRRFIPSAMRQQMMDENDRRTLEILINRKKEMEEPPPPPIEKMEANNKLEQELLETNVLDTKTA